MADWKTYVKAARNTARKQAPDARDAAHRATSRAGDYARAAGRAIDEGRRDEDRRPDSRGVDDPGAVRGEDRRRDEGRQDMPRRQDRSRGGSASDTATAPRSTARTDHAPRSLRDEAKIYAAVAGRTAQRTGRQAREAGIGGRIARAVRDALLIGGSLLVIWGALYAAGLPIPFSAVIIVVGIIVVIALASGLYAQFKRDQAPDEPDNPED